MTLLSKQPPKAVADIWLKKKPITLPVSIYAGIPACHFNPSNIDTHTACEIRDLIIDKKPLTVRDIRIGAVLLERLVEIELDKK